MNFRPLHDRVVVQRLESEEKTAGGIIIPDTAKEKPMEGRLLLLAQVRVTSKARYSRSTSRLATAFCLANGREPKSRSTVRII